MQKELDKCTKGEGVNHYENCRWLAEKYTRMLKENRVSSRHDIFLRGFTANLRVAVERVQDD